MFINYFVKTTERGAYGASLYRGKNDKIAADKAADMLKAKATKLPSIKLTIFFIFSP